MYPENVIIKHPIKEYAMRINIFNK